MKKKVVKRLFAAALTAVLAFGCLTGCGNDDSKQDASNNASNSENEADSPEKTKDEGEDATAKEGGTIMWLSNISSGLAYDNMMKYGEMVCQELGYKFTVVYGDAFNDPAGNLNAVKNGMTKDVVALITSQDGGIQNIMDEYPDLYVCGFNTDLAAVYADGGAAAPVKEYEKFLGNICDGYSDGKDRGKEYAQTIIDMGFKKVATIIFPAYAYPQLEIAANTLREEIDAYNSSAAAADKIEIIGENKVLEFQPLEEAYFLEEGYGDLDAVVAFCAGTDFVYPTMKSAMAAGTCSKDTKMITGGFSDDEAIVADIGGEGIIQSISFSPNENMVFPFVLIDNALTGKQYSDLDKTKVVDSLAYVIRSKEDIENVMSKSFNGTGDLSLLQLSWEDSKELFTRYNQDATYSDLLEALKSDQLTVAALKDR